jgi:hypothetical protein
MNNDPYKTGFDFEAIGADRLKYIPLISITVE